MDIEMNDGFANISKNYDTLNQIISCGIDIYWRNIILKLMLPYIYQGDIVLDVATGTFDIARAVVKRVDAIVFALDYSLNMLIEGSKKIQEYPNIIPIQADSRNIPIQDESIDCISISFGIRNIIPRELAFQEFYRLLKPGKSMYILEFCNPKEVLPTIQPLYITYISKIIPAIASLCGSDKAMYQYLAESILSFPLCEELQREIESAGFINVTYTKHSFGLVTIYQGSKPL